jgi:4-diphosphocytidyl-2-C-methyl-D-erythritol kinase
MEIGSSIGADVPFFVNGKNAVGDGIGDILRETSAITENLLVINPKIHNSTKEMFKLLEVWKGKNKFDSLNQQNHFWNVFIENNPKIEEFYNQIAEEYEINLSGSGSSMFIKYKDRDEIDNVIKKIPTNWRLFFCKPLQYSPICYIK